MAWNTRRKEYWMGIPLTGFDEVKAALALYMNGVRGAHDALGEATRGGDGGGMLFAFKTLAENGRGDKFLERLYDALKPAADPKGRGRAVKDYDWDGVGPFTKTAVELQSLDRASDLYMLGLHAAYVGRKGEIGLAEALKRERCLRWAEIDLHLEPIGNQFKIDFDAALEPIRDLLFPATTGEAVAQHFFEADDKSFVLLRRANLNVMMRHQWLSSRLNYDVKARPAPLQWYLDGAVLSGPVEERYKDEETRKPYPPTLEISVVQTGDLPAWKPEEKQDILDLADRIEKAYSGSASKVESTY